MGTVKRPLTDEQIDAIWVEHSSSDWLTKARAIEKAHGIGDPAVPLREQPEAAVQQQTAPTDSALVALSLWRAICDEAVAVVLGGTNKCLLLTEEMCVRLGSALEGEAVAKWKEVARDGLPPLDGETVFIGVNSAGYVGAFNDMNPDGCCLSGTPEGCTGVMSELRWWRKHIGPNAERTEAPSQQSGEQPRQDVAEASRPDVQKDQR